MSYRGDIRLEQTLDFKFTTRKFGTGAPHTLAGTPSLACYVGNGTTEITAGITLTADFDGKTGLNHVRIAATTANGYAASTDVQVVIAAGTVDGVSVAGEIVGEFSIENRSALRPTTAGRTLDVSAGGEAGVDWANVGSPSTTVGLSGTTVGTATTLGGTGVTAVQSGLATAAVLGDVKAKTDNLPSDPADQSVIIAATDAITSAIGELPSAEEIASEVAAPSASTIAAAVWATVLDGTRSATQLVRGFAAVLLGKASGLDTTTATYRNIADGKDVVEATVDEHGNRTAVSLDLD